MTKPKAKSAKSESPGLFEQSEHWQAGYRASRASRGDPNPPEDLDTAAAVEWANGYLEGMKARFAEIPSPDAPGTRSRRRS